MLLLLCLAAWADERPRIRQLGVEPGVYPTGPFNAITDVEGVWVGQVTLIDDEAVRTGVTAILPHPDPWSRRLPVATFVLNGNGEVTGLGYLDDLATLETPILLTNTLNVGKVMDACVEWLIARHPEIGITDDVPLPVVAECDDSTLNDIQGRHVQKEHVKQALDQARSGVVEEGAVGGGTGMIAYGFKAGIGTSSRVTPAGYTVGVLVQANMGDRREFIVDGVPVGKLLPESEIARHTEGSIVMVVATDAPLTPSQLRRLARHTTHGLARTGAISHNGSGDFAIAFSTRNAIRRGQEAGELPAVMLSNASLNPLYQATVEATEEAILNAVVRAQTTRGRGGAVAPAVPLEQLKALLEKRS